MLLLSVKFEQAKSFQVLYKITVEYGILLEEQKGEVLNMFGGTYGRIGD